MRITFHMGAHCTDEGQILRCLLANRAALVAEGIEIAEPSRYRPVFGETLNALRGAPASAEVQQTMLDAVLTEDAPEHVVFSHDAYLGIPARVLENGRFYPIAAAKTAAVRNLFPDHEASFALALRNPATFLPALRGKLKDVAPVDFARMIDPLDIRWSELVAAIRARNPDVPITVWCNEDTPLIWYEVLQAVSRHPPEMVLAGRDDFVSRLMSDEGMRRMTDYLATHPPANEGQRRRILAAFLDKFARPEEMEVEIDLPDWTDNDVEELTGRYEEDLLVIERIPGVRVITP